MMLISTAFSDGGVIPRKYTCDSDNLSPPLTFFEIPPDTKSLVLLVEDPDAPSPNFTHWLLYNIPPSTLRLPEGEIPSDILVGQNDMGHLGYDGPCPPSGTHRYLFQLFALNTTLELPLGVSKDKLMPTLDGHILDKTSLVGLYQRS